jgi:chromosome segregation ATPase
MSEECVNLQSEIKMLQEQLESERDEITNPKLTTLKAQLVETQVNLRKLQKESQNAPGHIQHLFQDQQKLIDDLSSYLKNKGSVEAVELQEKQM